MVKEGGLYLVEDTHTSYWKEFDGGFKNPNSFIEYSKNMIDSLYKDHINPENPVLVNEITANINSICFYDSMVVFEKSKRTNAFHIRKGKEAITTFDPLKLMKSYFERIKSRIFAKNVQSHDINNRRQ